MVFGEDFNRGKTYLLCLTLIRKKPTWFRCILFDAIVMGEKSKLFRCVFFHTKFHWAKNRCTFGCTFFNLTWMDKKSTMFLCIFCFNFDGKLMQLRHAFFGLISPSWKTKNVVVFISLLEKFLIYQRLSWLNVSFGRNVLIPYICRHIVWRRSLTLNSARMRCFLYWSQEKILVLFHLRLIFTNFWTQLFGKRK